MTEENLNRQTFTYSMRPENSVLLDELAKEFNTTRSRMIENMIIEKHKFVFKKKELFEEKTVKNKFCQLKEMKNVNE